MFQLLDATAAAAAAGGGGGGGLPPACCLLTAACRLLPCCCFSILLPWKNASAGQESIMALKDGIMRCNRNLRGLTSLLEPYIKHMFQLLDARGLPPACCLLTAACRLLPSCCFSILLPWKNAPAGQENTMVLKDGIMRCNGNLGGLTSLLEPYIKHMFQLLDALSALRCYCCCCWWWWWSWWWWWPASCLLLPHCCLPPAALLLLQHPFAMKKRSCRTGKHHGTEGRNNALQWQSRRPNVPSETLHKTYVSALRCSRPASCLLPPPYCLPPAAFLLLQHPFALKNAPAGQENTIPLKDGMVRCNSTPGGLTSLPKPYLKHMFRLLDVCLLLAHCCLPPAALLLFQHPFAMKKRTCRTGKHHGTEGRNNALQWQSRGPNVPSETLRKTYFSALRCYCCCCWWWWWSWWWWWPASCLLLPHCCLPPAALLLLQHPFAMKKRTCRTGKHHGTEGLLLQHPFAMKK